MAANPFSCTEADASLNLRGDALDWNIAGLNNRPNVASELKWNGLKSVGGGLKLSTLLLSDYPIVLKGSYNRIFAGNNRDLDFFEDDKQGLFLKSRADASKGELYDLALEIGMNIQCQKSIVINPHIGYSLDDQHLKEFDGFTEFNLVDPDDVGPIKGLNSSYNARWFGPYLGVKGTIPVLCGEFCIGFDYYMPQYRGKGHANLRTDIVHGDFFHRSRGWGHEFFAEFQSRIQEKIFFELKLKFGRFWTKRGTESETIKADEGLIPVKVALNRVEWSARSISAHFIKKF